MHFLEVSKRLKTFLEGQSLNIKAEPKTPKEISLKSTEDFQQGKCM